MMAFPEEPRRPPAVRDKGHGEGGEEDHDHRSGPGLQAHGAGPTTSLARTIIGATRSVIFTPKTVSVLVGCARPQGMKPAAFTGCAETEASAVSTQPPPMDL